MTDKNDFLPDLQRQKLKKLENKFKELEFYSKSGDGTQLHYEFFKNFTSHHTRLSYKNDLQKFFEFFHKAFKKPMTHPKLVKRFHIVAYKDFLAEQGGIDGAEAGPKTIGRKLAALNTYFKFLMEKGIVEMNPVEGVKRPRQVVRTETNALDNDQVRELLTNLKDHTLTESLHKAILYTLFATGMRVSEVISLKREDFGKLKNMKVLRFKAKGGKFRTVPVKNEVAKVIEHYLKMMAYHDRKHELKDPLFQPSRNNHTDIKNKHLNRSSIFRIIQLHAKMAGIFDRVSPHSARATLITSLLEKGVDIYKVAQAVGHEAPQTTKNYDKRGKKLEDSALLEVDYLV